MTRLSMLTMWSCQWCGGARRALRRVALAPFGLGLIEISTKGGFLYCPRCDGPMASIAADNPDADLEQPHG